MTIADRLHHHTEWWSLSGKGLLSTGLPRLVKISEWTLMDVVEKALKLCQLAPQVWILLLHMLLLLLMLQPLFITLSTVNQPKEKLYPEEFLENQLPSSFDPFV